MRSKFYLRLYIWGLFSFIEQVAAKTPPQGWNSTGCWTDPADAHLLWTSYDFFDKNDMTWLKCAGLCEGEAYRYMGLEDGYTCYCGDTLHGNQVQNLPNTCNLACTGDPTESCGGTGLIMLFEHTLAYSSTSSATLSRRSTSTTKTASKTSSISRSSSLATGTAKSTSSTSKIVSSTSKPSSGFSSFKASSSSRTSSLASSSRTSSISKASSSSLSSKASSSASTSRTSSVSKTSMSLSFKSSLSSRITSVTTSKSYSTASSSSKKSSVPSSSKTSASSKSSTGKISSSSSSSKISLTTSNKISTSSKSSSFTTVNTKTSFTLSIETSTSKSTFSSKLFSSSMSTSSSKSSSIRFSSSSRSTSTSKPTSSPSPVPLGNYRPYDISGSQAFASADNPKLFAPDTFTAYGLNSSNPAITIVAVNTTDESNNTITLIYDFINYDTTGDMAVISPDGTNIILHNNGSVTGFAGPDCTIPVTVDIGDQTATRKTRRSTTSNKNSPALEKRGEYIITPVVEVSLSLKDKCGALLGGAKPVLYCGLTREEERQTSFLLRIRQPFMDMEETSVGIYRGQCAFPTVRDQSVDLFCTNVADAARKFCNDWENLGRGVESAGGSKVVCESLGTAVTAIPRVGAVAGPIVGLLCTVGLAAFSPVCGGVEFRSQYCVLPPDKLTLVMRVGGYGSVGYTDFQERDVVWRLGDLGPGPVTFNDYDDSTPTGFCTPSDCEPGQETTTVIGPWMQVYDGNLFPPFGESICYATYYIPSEQTAINPIVNGVHIENTFERVFDLCSQAAYGSGLYYSFFVSKITFTETDYSPPNSLIGGFGCTLYPCELSSRSLTWDYETQNSNDDPDFVRGYATSHTTLYSRRKQTVQCSDGKVLY